jgi:hypothetical protein
MFTATAMQLVTLVNCQVTTLPNSHNLALLVTTTVMPTTSTTTFALSMTLMKGTSTQWFQPYILVIMLLLTTIQAVIVLGAEQMLFWSTLT